MRCGTDQVNDADADPTNELQNLQQVLQRGNNAGGLSITGLSSLSTGQLCLQDGCKSRWSDVGGNPLNIDGDNDGIPHYKLVNGKYINDDCDDDDPAIGRAIDGNCNSDNDIYIDSSAYNSRTDNKCDYDDNHPGGWSGRGCEQCPFGYRVRDNIYMVCLAPNGNPTQAICAQYGAPGLWYPKSWQMEGGGVDCK